RFAPAMVASGVFAGVFPLEYGLSRKDVDGMLGLDAVIVETANHFEAAEHAVDAVEASAGRLRIRVRARDDRR
ncbi:hypothetical protein QM334_37780, partial [Burkholderia cenocepacia]